MSILIKDAIVVTQNEKREITRNDVLVVDNRIEEVAKGINEKAEYVIDAKGRILMPGLINMHTHVAMTLFRGYGEGLPLARWLEEKIWPIEAKQTPKDARIAAMLAIVEMLRSGTTAFCDQCLLGAKEIGQAANEIGIRAHVSQGLFDLLPGRDFEGESIAMERAAYPQDRLVSYGIGPHSPYTCSDKMLSKAGTFAKKQKRKLHMHVSETRKETFDVLKDHKKRPFEYLDSLGLVNQDSIFAHASWVTKKEIALAGAKKLNVVTCPASNLKLATGGICPVFEYDDAGANVCIGTDSAASNNSLNMFESMKLTALLQKHRYWKADVISAQKVLDFATINGAKALGINMEAGGIRKGAYADLVVLDRGANLTPGLDHISNIVYAAHPGNVSHVIVDGKPIIIDRRFVGFDEPALLDRAEELAVEMMKR